MPSPRVENILNSDGRAVSLIAIISFIALAIMSGAGFAKTVSILILAAAAIWIYTRIFKPQQTASKPKRASADEKTIRETALQDLADTLPRALIGLNRKADVVYANDAAFKLLSPDILGQPIAAYLRTSSVRSNMERAFESETPPSLSVHVLQPTERYIDVEFSQAIQIDPSEKIVFALLTDSTLAQVASEKSADFLANASHELKTPIASMKGFIETLRGHAKDDPAAREKFLKIMAEQAERMERLVTDLLSLRRIETREHIAPSETADLRKAVEAAYDALTVLAEEKGVTLEVSLPDIQTAPILGKTDECIQLFLNLMENGIKLSPDGAIVSISLERLPNWTGQAFPDAAPDRRIVNLAPSKEPVWKVMITDAGPGFSKTHLPRIGERFYRVAGDLPAQEKGTGLGLAIVKHIAMRHRAGLFVKTQHRDDAMNETSGTTFSVIFPIKGNDPQQA